MTVSPALSAYLGLSRLAEYIAPAILARRQRRGKEDPDRLAERRGHASMPRPGGRLIWLHGASVGEGLTSLPLISALQDVDGEASFLVTTGTVTSARRLAGLLPEGAVHQYVPVDTAASVARFLDHWRPDLAIWIESEIWPRLLVETARRDIPSALINARLSEASARSWGWAPAMARRLLGGFGAILCQDTETVARLDRFGIASRFVGNLKALYRAKAPVADAAQIAEALGARPVWLAASTHPGEEESVLAAHELVLRQLPEALLILAPRHPERADQVQSDVQARGLSAVRRSLAPPEAEHAVWLADRLGEMDTWYGRASVTFVGGSLADVGGHTPFEPITHGSAVLTGPHVENFRPAYAALDSAEAVRRVVDAASLADAVTALLSDPDLRAAQVGRARAAHRDLVPDIAAIAGDLARLMRPGV